MFAILDRLKTRASNLAARLSAVAQMSPSALKKLQRKYPLEAFLKNHVEALPEGLERLEAALLRHEPDDTAVDAERAARRARRSRRRRRPRLRPTVSPSRTRRAHGLEEGTRGEGPKRGTRPKERAARRRRRTRRREQAEPRAGAAREEGGRPSRRPRLPPGARAGPSARTRRRDPDEPADDAPRRPPTRLGRRRLDRRPGRGPAGPTRAVPRDAFRASAGSGRGRGRGGRRFARGVLSGATTRRRGRPESERRRRRTSTCRGGERSPFSVRRRGAARHLALRTRATSTSRRGKCGTATPTSATTWPSTAGAVGAGRLLVHAARSDGGVADVFRDDAPRLAGACRRGACVDVVSTCREGARTEPRVVLDGPGGRRRRGAARPSGATTPAAPFSSIGKVSSG